MKFVKMIPEMVEGQAERALWVCEFTFKWVATTYAPAVQPAPYASAVPMCMAHLAEPYGARAACDPIVRAFEPIHPIDLQAARCRHQPITHQSKHADWHIAAIRKLEARKFE